MTHEEKRVWIRMVVSVAAYAVYVVTILGRADGRPLVQVPYAAALLWTATIAIVLSIALEIPLGNPRTSRAKDVRDREIGRLGDYIGQSFVIAGASAAMLMAMARWDQFWIANVIYLGFLLSLVLGSIAKVVMYRRSMPQW